MKAIYPIAVVASIVVLSSCFSSMKVRVDALNMPAFKATYLYNVEVLTTRERNIRYLTSPAFNLKIQQLSAKLTTFIDTSGEVPDNDKKKFQEDIRSRGNDAMGEVVAKGGAALQSAATVKMG